MTDNRVALVDGPLFYGTGVLITPNEVLTANHVLSGQSAASLHIDIGRQGDTAFASVGALNIHSAGGGLGDASKDFALVHLNTSVPGAGIMGIAPGFTGGTANISGYPISAGGYQQVTTQATLRSAAVGIDLLLGVNTLGSGSSGGPAWVIGSDGRSYVAGLASTTAAWTKLTSEDVALIEGWVAQDRGTAATQAPGTSVVLPETVDGQDFDAAFYRAHNADVAASGIDPLQHYLNFGWKEGRNPNQLFNTSFYLSRNADVAAAGINPLVHFAAFGWKEQRDPSAQFSVASYERLNPDVAAARIDPLAHYLSYGVGEGRRAI